jgi:hypothetical protein
MSTEYLIKYHDKEDMEVYDTIRAESAIVAIETFNNSWAEYGRYPHIVAIYKRLDMQVKVDE